MISIDKEYSSEYIIQKSKFYSFAYPVFDEDKCKEILDNLREKYYDATHICFAYILSTPRLEKCSDDGEPTGTAGKPIIELLKKRKLENVLVAVVRYFGGIKLGAGGLVRAYTNSANLAISDSKIIEFVEYDKFKCEVPHSMASNILLTIEKSSGKVLKVLYNENVYIEFVCENVDSLKKQFWEVDFLLIGKEIICQ